MFYPILTYEVNCKAKIDISLNFRLILFGTESAWETCIYFMFIDLFMGSGRGAPMIMSRPCSSNFMKLSVLAFI